MDVANIYDNGPISPVARIKDRVAVWTNSTYIPYQVLWIEGIPASRPFQADIVAISGQQSLPASGQVAKQLVNCLQMVKQELLHLRWYTLDDVQGSLFELNNMPRYAPQGGQATVDLFTPDYDPWLATTTFYILGQVGNNNTMIGVNNPYRVAQPTARFVFFGYRYVLSDALKQSTLTDGGPMTYLPAQGFGGGGNGTILLQ